MSGENRSPSELFEATMLSAMADELGLIEKDAFISNIGTMLFRPLRSVAQAGKATGQSVGQNLLSTAKGFATPIESMKRGWDSNRWTMAGELWRDGAQPTSWYGKAFQPVAKVLPGGKPMELLAGGFALSQAAPEEDPTGADRSRIERLGRAVGNIGGGLVGAPFGFSGAIGGTIAGETAGGLIGKTIHRVVGKKKTPAKPLQEVPVQQSPNPGEVPP